MTNETKNKIWAMLTQEEKEDFQGMYKLKGSNFDKGYNAALDEIFGSHNLTAQAEEKPKEASIKSEDGRIVIPIKAEYGDSVYAAYRLDLAKEIAIAIINTANKDARYGDTLPYVAVKIANEIVKRLKETEG